MLARRELTGGAAKGQIEIARQMLGEDSFELFKRIINKDLRCAVTSTIVNKLIPKFIPVFEVMLAHNYEEKRIKRFPVAEEPKLDGVRVICIIQNGEAKFLSRTGKPFPAIEHIGVSVVASLERLARRFFHPLAWSLNPDHHTFIQKYLGNDESAPSLVLEGEVMSGSFNKTVGDVHRKNETALDAEYHIFDAIPLEGLSER